MYTHRRAKGFPFETLLTPFGCLATHTARLEIWQRSPPSNRQLLNRGIPLGFRFSGCTTAPLIPLWWVMVHVVSHRPVKPLFKCSECNTALSSHSAITHALMYSCKTANKAWSFFWSEGWFTDTPAAVRGGIRKSDFARKTLVRQWLMI